MLETKHISCDLCVVGGGLSGMAAAISAAREGLQVVLMHERAVLGGNASSEIRMWISGAHGESNRETGIIEEIILENHYRNPSKSYAVWDTVLYDFIRKEKNIRLLLNCTCMDCETETGDFSHGRKIRIRSVTGYQMTTQSFYTVEAPLFADCSGDSILAPLTGAEFRVGREAAAEFHEDLNLPQEDKKTMGMSCLIQGRETTNPIPYLPHTWSTKLTDAHFEDRMPNLYDDAENFWYLELGGNRDSIADTEEIRDELLSLATGTWDYIKRTPKFKAQNWDLDFLGFMPGKRESRRMMGEYLLTQRDVSDGVVFEDEIAFGGWPLDDHFPDGFFHRGVPNTDIATPAPTFLPKETKVSAKLCNWESLLLRKEKSKNISFSLVCKIPKLEDVSTKPLISSLILITPSGVLESKKIIFSESDFEKAVLVFPTSSILKEKSGSLTEISDLILVKNASASSLKVSQFVAKLKEHSKQMALLLSPPLIPLSLTSIFSEKCSKNLPAKMFALALPL